MTMQLSELKGWPKKLRASEYWQSKKYPSMQIAKASETYNPYTSQGSKEEKIYCHGNNDAIDRCNLTIGCDDIRIAEILRSEIDCMNSDVLRIVAQVLSSKMKDWIRVVEPASWENTP